MVIFMLVSFFLMSEAMTAIEDERPENFVDYAPSELRNVLTQGRNYLSIVRWPKGIVPYTIDEGFSESDRESIRHAMDDVQQHTCIRWVERNNDSVDFVSIENGDRCWSNYGKRGGKQVLILNVNKCLKKGIILHELLHTLGFLHEHQRPDRDKYVTVNWDYIKPGEWSNFEGYSFDFTLDLDYDYRSVMHYPAYDKAWQQSVPSLTPNYRNVPLEDLGLGMKLGYLTELDIQKINKFYGCSLKKHDNSY